MSVSGDMDEEELNQCLRDIQSWLVQKCGEDGSKYSDTPGATSDDIAVAVAAVGGVLPYGVGALLTAHNGRMPVFDYTGLSCADIAKVISSTSASPKWVSGMVPFAQNVDGDLFVVVRAGVARWNPESGHRASPYTIHVSYTHTLGRIAYDET
jgi:hypothetical protein